MMALIGLVVSSPSAVRLVVVISTGRLVGEDTTMTGAVVMVVVVDGATLIISPSEDVTDGGNNITGSVFVVIRWVV